MDECLKPFTDLPISPDAIWICVELSVADLPSFLPKELAESIPANSFYSALWYSTQTGEYEIFFDNHESLDLLMNGLVKFALNQETDKTRPEHLVLTSSAATTDRLKAELEGTGTAVHFDPEVSIIPQLQEIIFNTLAEQMLLHTKLPTLASVGCETSLLREYASAASEFYRSGCWELFNPNHLLRVKTPQSPRNMSYVTVFNENSPKLGIGLYEDEMSHWNLLNPNASEVNSYLATLMFHSLDEVQLEDKKLWLDLNLPLDSGDSFPITVILEAACPSTPEPEDIHFMTTLLRTLATTSQEEIDSGEWEKSVNVNGTVEQCKITIPDILSPPTPKQWKARGVTLPTL